MPQGDFDADSPSSSSASASVETAPQKRKRESEEDRQYPEDQIHSKTKVLQAGVPTPAKPMPGGARPMHNIPYVTARLPEHSKTALTVDSTLAIGKMYQYNTNADKNLSKDLDLGSKSISF